jgi:beta-glucosidase
MGTFAGNTCPFPWNTFVWVLFGLLFIGGCQPSAESDPHAVDDQVEALLAQMTLEEKIGQLIQLNGDGGKVTAELKEAVVSGRVGSILNEVDTATLRELQRLAVEESRLGIPLMIARDVIHGFKTIFPIPLGQAASWNEELIEQGARVAAIEAASQGIHWTFAPMIDISRDPRWGRIAETLGEDPYLTSALGSAMVRGFQGDSLNDPTTIATCAKHFVGYGAAEGGRDYNSANIPEVELHNVYFPPFKAAMEAGATTFMTSFNDLNGVPASSNAYLFKEILRDEWGFEGFVVSDWVSIEQLLTHGVAEDAKACAEMAFTAGVEMEMVSTTYRDHLASLIEEGVISEKELDTAVRRILRVKKQLGLFENPYTHPEVYPPLLDDDHLQAAREAAQQSCVLLKNQENLLPLNSESLRRIAVIGPLADDPYEQLGTWIFDGDPQHTVTALTALKNELEENVKIDFVKALETSRSRETDQFRAAVRTARRADVAILVLGEESILSGEAHSRADIGLPGAQLELLKRIKETGTPVISVIMAGRPLTLEAVAEHSDALLFAWHPGTMGGPAIVDLLLGKVSPSGKLPVTFPRMVGQIPIYYAHRNTGKPATAETFVPIDEIPVRAFQTSVGNTSHYLDAGFQPLYPFGYGLSYTTFSYENLSVSGSDLGTSGSLTVEVDLKNTGAIAGREVAQLYIRDLVSSVARPVRELKGFQSITLAPGEQKTLRFELSTEDLAYYYPGKGWEVEQGEYQVWVGGDSNATLTTTFTVGQE